MTRLDMAIIVPTYRRPHTLDALLTGLMPQARAHGARVIVVNDGSHDDAYAQVIARHGQGILYDIIDRNVGRGRATNRGIELADADWLLFTDDDVIMPDDWLDVLAGIVARYRAIDVVGGRTVAAHNDRPSVIERFTIRRDFYIPQPHFTHGTLKCLITACLAVRRETLEAVGGLDSDFPCGQDHNLTWRLRKAGAAIYVTHRWYCGHDQRWSLRDLTHRLHDYAYWHVMQAELSHDPVDYDANPATGWMELLRRLPEEWRALVGPGRYAGLPWRERTAYRALDIAGFWAWNRGGIAAGSALRRRGS